MPLDLTGDDRWKAIIQAFVNVIGENRQDAGLLSTTAAPPTLRLTIDGRTTWRWEPTKAQLDASPRLVALQAYESYKFTSDQARSD